MKDPLSVIGQPVPRRGLREKITGEARYTADVVLPGMLHTKVLRSPHAYAEIMSIDTKEAEALPGVHAVLTPFDEITSGRVAEDMSILDRYVRFVGDEVVAVAAEDEDIAEAALDLIFVEYRALPHVLDVEQALTAQAPKVHPQGNLWRGRPLILERGDTEEGFREADLVFEETYRLASHSGASLEPRVALALWEGDELTVWKSSRGVHQDQEILSAALKIPRENIRVVGPVLGAGYGNKDEGRAGVIAALLSRKSGRPVRLEYSRYEEFVAGRVRHGAIITLKIGVRRDGTILSISNRTVLNTGAYLASGPGTLRRAAQGSLYLYRCPNVRYEGYLVYTNSPVAGSYRGLGAPQGHFALEVHMDSIAKSLGMDPLEFRLKNHVGVDGQPGVRTTPTDEIIDTQPVEGGIPFSSNGLRECLIRGSQLFGYPRRDTKEDPLLKSVRRGTGMAMCIYRGGPGRNSSAKVIVYKNGRIDLITGIMDVGEGAHTVLTQMTAETLGCGYEDVGIIVADTATTPEAPITAGSTATFSMGLAVQEAALQVRHQLLDVACSLLETTIDEIDIKDGNVFLKCEPTRTLSLFDVAAQMEGDRFEASAIINPGSRDFIVNSFAAHFAQVDVDIDTGNVKVSLYVAAHDSGTIINRNGALNQVEGGISQMLGLTILEELVVDVASGVTLNGSYLEHRCPTIAEYPPINVVFIETPDPLGPFGAKALGEVPSVPVAAAVVNAIHDAIGIRFTEVPVTPDKVLNALKKMGVK